MQQRKSDRRKLNFSFGVKLTYVLTGALIAIGSLMIANDKLFQGSIEKGDPLLVLTMLAGLLGGVLIAMHWENRVEEYGIAVIGYVAIGLCIGATIVGTIYDGQNLKWVGPICLIVCPIVILISKSGNNIPLPTKRITIGQNYPK